MAINKKNADGTDVVEKVKRIKITGFVPLKFQNHTITQKRSGRFEVVTDKGINVHGPAKEKILFEAKVVKGSFKKAVSETPAT